MKIRIERLEIEAPDLIKNYLETLAQENQAVDERDNSLRQTLVGLAAEFLKKGLDAFVVKEPWPTEPPCDDHPPEVSDPEEKVDP